MSEPPFPPFAALRAFEATGRLGGIRRGADALGVSHAIVSRHLSAMERRLGVVLFDRRSGRLTDAGRDYHQRVAGALAEIAAATEAARADRRGRLVISCAPGLALHWLTHRLNSFTARQPQVMIDLRTSDSPPNFANNEVDGDIRYMRDTELQEAPPDVHTVELQRPPVFPVTSPALAAKLSGRIEDASDLCAMPLIEEQDDAEWRMWFAAQGISSPVIKPVARYGPAHLALAAARAGQGIALANTYLVAQDLAEGRLVIVEPKVQPLVSPQLGAYVFRADRRRWNDPAVARFRRWLTSEFDRDAVP